MKYKCFKCENTDYQCNFTTLSNLRRHAKKFHPKISLEIAPFRYAKSTPLSAFRCNICQKTFNHKESLRRHLKTHNGSTNRLHQQQSQIKTTRHSNKCPLCEYNGAHKKDTLDHFKNVHEISFNSSDLIFETIEDFNKWKTEIETITNTRFVKRGSESHKSHITTNYVCHRSGNYLPEGKGERHLKTQGSSKINGFCPASIQLHLENKKIKVQYLETHVGHDINIDHLQLTASERQVLAEKITANVPFDDILDDIRDSVTDFSLKRIHLLTKKDLFNIKSSLNLNSTSDRQTNEATSLESWVIEMQRIGDCVVFYKPQGIDLEELPQLREEDFVLIIMTPAQCELLKNYGLDCICIDGTRGLNNYNFELRTLFIIDDLREGFPCAFLLSNRCDIDVMSVFFNQIKLKTGSISPKMFMSDLGESNFSAWLQVMGVPEKRLFCTWHVDWAWRKNLSKIKTKDKQVMIYKTLRRLLEETDPVNFERMLEKHCSDTSDPETIDFIVYFQNNYQKNTENWAYCYRLHSELYTNTNLEHMHRTIKNICLGEKKVKRLDKGIAALIRFNRNKFIDRFIAVNKGKISSKLKDIRKRHKDVKDLNPYLIVRTEYGWELPSSANTASSEIYFIQEVEVNDSCACQLTCSECDICIHRYYCTCLDSATKFNMCKHIHLLAQYRKQNGNSENITTDSDDEREDQNGSYGHCNDEMEVLISQLPKKQKTDPPIIDRQNKIMEKFRHFLFSNTSHENLDTIEKIVDSLPHMVATSEYVKETIQ